MSDRLAPYMPHDPMMALAWLDCLRWAIHAPEVLDAFVAATGVTVPALGSVLDRMVDEATGRNEDIATQFLAWFNEYIWGENPAQEDSP